MSGINLNKHILEGPERLWLCFSEFKEFGNIKVKVIKHFCLDGTIDGRVLNILVSDVSLCIWMTAWKWNIVTWMRL